MCLHVEGFPVNEETCAWEARFEASWFHENSADMRLEFSTSITLAIDDEHNENEQSSQANEFDWKNILLFYISKKLYNVIIDMKNTYS